VVPCKRTVVAVGRGEALMNPAGADAFPRSVGVLEVMTLPIKLISTDFDGTIFAEFENPPIPAELEEMLRDLQARGGKWVINTGRDMSSLMETLGRARISIQPDYLVLVEREIHIHDGVRYMGLEKWNSACTRAHAELFVRVRLDLPRLTDWINARFRATVYEDPYSPFCLIAGNNGDADLIHEYLEEYSRGIPNLTVVRNDIYARFSHQAYNKGTALAEIARQLGLNAAQVFAVGDHLNDIPMLSRTFAHWLAAPQNAIEPVKSLVRGERGFISDLPAGKGVAQALAHCLREAAR
jgi:HAD superfamily hydrolase (TIGR01484 family)